MHSRKYDPAFLARNWGAQIARQVIGGPDVAREHLRQHAFHDATFTLLGVHQEMFWYCELNDAYATSSAGKGAYGATPMSAAINVLGYKPMTKNAWNKHPGVSAREH